MTSCIFKMGCQASRDYIQQFYDGDESMAYIIADIFEKIAEENGSSAILNVHTSEVHVDVEEVGGVGGWKELNKAHMNREDTRFSTWLQKAHDRAKARWGDGDL